MKRRAAMAGLLAAPVARGAPVARAAEPVDLLLVLAVDASGSVTPARFRLQKEGYIEAFRHPRVHAAIAGGPRQSIAVSMFQWTGRALQHLVADWRALRSADDCVAFARAIERVPRQLHGGGTSISGAIDYARALLKRAPHAADRAVIDVSGDGANNNGRPPAAARDDAIAEGITINGLPILFIEPHLDEHYRDHVIGGPGAFMIEVEDDAMFAQAILRKLITEIAALPAPLPA